MAQVKSFAATLDPALAHDVLDILRTRPPRFGRGFRNAAPADANRH